jgi:single-stranded-DNA-specific exonuclease
MMATHVKTQSPIWVHPDKNPELVETIVSSLTIDPVIAQVLVSRGFKTVDEVRDFLYVRLSNLLDPKLFPEMDKAVHRVLLALERGEAVLVYGDNDVDGMTAAALLTEFIRSIGLKAVVNIPKRESKSQIGDAIQIALKNQCKLMITVDCGITAAKEIETVVENGIDVIVTDHHEPTSTIPLCVATLNPKLINSTYPNRELTGVGVAFKLAQSVYFSLQEQNKIDLSKSSWENFLDLVALGTIADMGSLRGENRILVHYGLKLLKKMQRVGLAKLFEVSELRPKDSSPIEIASKIAPRLNSLGRIADPIKGVELLLVRDSEQAEELAKELNLINLERQKIEKEVAEDTKNIIFLNPEILKEKAIVLYSDKWHQGIIAILAARIANQYNRPTIIISIKDGVGKGSGRTIPEFPLLPVLKKNADLLIDFGGHDYAAGLTIREENIPKFQKRFIKAAQEALNDQDVIPKLHLDAKLNFSDLSFDFMEYYHLLEPFGNENQPPIFYCDAVQLWRPQLLGKFHIKLFFEQGWEGVAFGLAERRDELRGGKGVKLQIAFTPTINRYQNKQSIQLHIKDFKVLG